MAGLVPAIFHSVVAAWRPVARLVWGMRQGAAQGAHQSLLASDKDGWIAWENAPVALKRQGRSLFDLDISVQFLCKDQQEHAGCGKFDLWG